MVSSVTDNTVDLALISRGAASVALAAEAQAILNAPSNAKQRNTDIPSPLEVVQSTNSLVDGRTLVAAQELSDQNKQQSGQQSGQQSSEGEANPNDSPDGKQIQSSPANPQGLSEEQLKQVRDLKKIDREVRAHERSHQNAAPELTGPASFQTVRGPDGKLYAVGGEVSIDTGEAATPEATIQKLKRVIKAALAPLEPSSQDRKVAAQARGEISEARGEIRQEKAQERRETQEAAEESQDQNQGKNSANTTSTAQSDITNAIQAFQAAAALGS